MLFGAGEFFKQCCVSCSVESNKHKNFNFFSFRLVAELRMGHSSSQISCRLSTHTENWLLTCNTGLLIEPSRTLSTGSSQGVSPQDNGGLNWQWTPKLVGGSRAVQIRTKDIFDLMNSTKRENAWSGLGMIIRECDSTMQKLIHSLCVWPLQHWEPSTPTSLWSCRTIDQSESESD